MTGTKAATLPPIATRTRTPGFGDGAMDPYRSYPIEANPDRSQWDKREDGSAKGDGWLGVRKRPDGGVSSEISVGVNIGGKDVDIPLMVPGLSRDEMDYLMKTPAEKVVDKLPRSIMDKAVAHARKRMAAGKSPFHGQDDATP